MMKLIVTFRNFANVPKNGDDSLIVQSLVKVTMRVHHKGQGQLIPHHAMKAHRTADVQLHSFISLDLDEDEWSTTGPGSLTPVKEALHPLNRRLGGPQYPSEQFGPSRTPTPDRPDRSLVTIQRYLES